MHRMKKGTRTISQSVLRFARISADRGNPFERDDNPPLKDERDAFLAKVAKLKGKGFEPDFWSVLLEG